MGRPNIHEFDDTGTAYDALQCDESIKDGDVFVVARDGVVGIAVEAWPVSITKECGHFHSSGPLWDWSAVKSTSDPTKTTDYSASWEAAKLKVVEIGAVLADPPSKDEVEHARNRELVHSYLHFSGRNKDVLSEDESWELYCLGERASEELAKINSGWDWSHVRDSSPAAYVKMADWLRERGYGLEGKSAPTP